MRSSSPHPPFQTGTFRHVVRILDEISATKALSGEMLAPFASWLKYSLRLCDQLIEEEAAMLKKAPPNLPQNVVTFRSLSIQRQIKWTEIKFLGEKSNFQQSQLASLIEKH